MAVMRQAAQIHSKYSHDIGLHLKVRRINNEVILKWPLSEFPLLVVFTGSED